MFGFLNVLKPSGMTAHDVVSRVRKLTKIKQVGHGGTLDPAASGVLPVAVGKACRLLRVLPSTKIYEAEILLGTTTTTDDLEGEISALHSLLPDADQITREISSFIGDQLQRPPVYSAVHHQGQRLYRLARAGRAPEIIPARPVTIHSISVISITLPTVTVSIACSAGTYIRAIARDLGERLRCGACLKSLLRLQAGPFRLEAALSLDQLQELSEAGRLNEALISPAAVLNLPCLKVNQSESQRLSFGQSLKIEELSHPFALTDQSESQVLVDGDGLLVALCNITKTGELQPEVVIIHGT